MVEEFRW